MHDNNFRNINYDNCVVTTHEDSSSSDDSYLVTPEDKPEDLETYPFTPEAPGEDQEAYASEPSDQLTAEDFKDITFNPEDAFIYLWGTLKKIKEYVQNLKEENDKEWLNNEIEIFNTVLMNHSNIFTKNEFITINGVLYVKDKSSKRKKQTKKEKDKKTKKKKDKQPLTDDVQGEPSVVNEVDSVPNNNNVKDESKSEIRRSQRLKDLEEGDIVYCDKLSYVSLKMASALSQPLDFLITSTPLVKSEKKSFTKGKNKFQSTPNKKTPRAKSKSSGTKSLNEVKNYSTAGTSTPPAKSQNSERTLNKRNKYSKSTLTISKIKPSYFLKKNPRSFCVASKRKQAKDSETVKAKAKTNKKIKVGKAKSFGGVEETNEESDSTNQDVKRNLRKRRSGGLDTPGASEERKEKRFRAANSSVDTALNRETRRKLYSPDAWLDTLTNITQCSQSLP